MFSICGGGDRLKTFTIAACALYFLSGLVVTTLGAVLTPLLAHYHLTYTIGGQLVFLGQLGFLIGVPLATVLLKRLQEKTVLSIAAAIVAVAQLGMLSLPPFGWVIACNFLNGMSVAALETVVATLMIEVFIGRRAVAMSYLEVAFGLGAIFAPMFASFLITHNMWRYAFFLTGVFAIFMAVVWKVLTFSKENVSQTAPMDASRDIPRFIKRITKWQLLALFVVMIFMYAGVEGSLNNYLPAIFITHLNENRSHASISIGIFWVLMVVGRLMTGWIIRKITYSRFLTGSILGTMICLILFATFKHDVLGYILVGLLGLIMSGMYSITMVYANHTLPGKERIVTSAITAFSGLGGAVLPGMIGWAMDHASAVSVIWIITAMAGLYLVALLSVLVIHYVNAKQTPSRHVAS